MTRDELKTILDEHAKWLTSKGDKRANLQDADLQGADLRGAHLQGADLQGADLQDANLQGAHLQGADLRGAHLQGADLRGANLPPFQLPAGDIRVYKRASGKIVHLLIPRHVKRTASMVGRKCRAERAFVLAIQGDDPVISDHDGKTVYKIGEWVIADNYDPDPRIECSGGIHFFATRKEAEEY